MRARAVPDPPGERPAAGAHQQDARGHRGKVGAAAAGQLRTGHGSGLGCPGGGGHRRVPAGVRRRRTGRGGGAARAGGALGRACGRCRSGGLSFRVRAFGARAICCGGAAGCRRRSGNRGCGGSRRRQDRLRRGRGRCWWARPVGRLRPGGPDGLGGRAGGFQAAVVPAAGCGGGGRRSCGFRRVGQGCASGGEAYRGGQDSCGRRGEDSAERRRRGGHCYLSGPAVPRCGYLVPFQSSITRRRAANPSIVRPSRGMGFSPGFPAAEPPGFSGPFRGPQCTRGRG